MQQMFGYSIALVGVFSYNRAKQLTNEAVYKVEGGERSHEVAIKAKGSEGIHYVSIHHTDSLESTLVSADRERA
jgi:hypothetical protein